MVVNDAEKQFHFGNLNRIAYTVISDMEYSITIVIDYIEYFWYGKYVIVFFSTNTFFTPLPYILK